jgi:hemolysin activation/secretion protein
MRWSGTAPGVRSALILSWLVSLATPGLAQQIFGPAEQRPDVDDLPKPRPPDALVLPPIAPPEGEDSLSAGLMVHVGAFAFDGSSVFDDAELARVTAPYTGRRISSEELMRAAAAVTALYAAHGYVTSGAVVPDQDVDAGVVRLLIVEGRLAAIEVNGNSAFRDSYFQDRLRRAGHAPIHVERLEAALRRIQRNRYVERVEARLEPTESLGESILRLKVVERRPWDLVVEGSNEHSPAIGALGGRLSPTLANLLGHADELEASFDSTEGLFEWEVRYELPINSYDTRLRGFARETDANVVEEPFDALGIHSESTTYGAAILHPLLRSGADEVWLRIAGERRRLESCLEILPPVCEPFSFLGGQPDPKQVASVVRLVGEWTRASTTDVFAARSTFSVGVDLFDASTAGDADGQFLAWLAQLQWVHRFPESLLGTQLALRGDLQLADDPLLTLEKFAFGGRRSVRGYRENEVVRDNGVVGSLELRVPLLRTGLGRSLLALVPFGDIGHGWSEGRGREERTLASLGVGLRVTPWRWLAAEVFWGGRIEGVATPDDRDLQDDGAHFAVTLRPFGAIDALLDDGDPGN